ncbi:MAG: hypothetical protein V4649_14660 [Bacteroidota bacterium]
MKVNFFKPKCTQSTSEMLFGLCDKDDEKPAFINVDKSEKWIATVVNSAPPKRIQFTALDHCIDVLRENGDMDNRCDVLLEYETRLLFIELKTKRADWKSEGLGQIEATIKRMIHELPAYYYGFKKRKAVVANPKSASPAFQESDKELREFYKRNYKIHLQFDAEIKIE